MRITSLIIIIIIIIIIIKVEVEVMNICDKSCFILQVLNILGKLFGTVTNSKTFQLFGNSSYKRPNQ